MSCSVAIIGLGAIGGSLAFDLQSAGYTVSGFDRDARAVATMRAAGVDARIWNECDAVTADVVVMATPVAAALDVLRALCAKRAWQCVTDVGSTKRQIAAQAEALGCADCFVGSHPLAGMHESGAHAARSGLFRSRTVFLTHHAQTSQQAVQLVKALWRAVGAQVEKIDAAEHDRRMAWLSHLPQLTCNALALALQSGGFERAQLGPGGQDMTRLAGSSATVWRDIIATNADVLDEPLARMIEMLAELRRHVQARNIAAIDRTFSESGEWYRGARQTTINKENKE